VNGRLDFSVPLVAVVVGAALSSVALPDKNGGSADFCSSAVFPNANPVTDLLSTVVVSGLPIGGNKEGVALGPAKIFGKVLADFLSFPSRSSASVTGFSNTAVEGEDPEVSADDGALKFDRGGGIDSFNTCEVAKKFGTLVPFDEGADVDNADIEGGFSKLKGGKGVDAALDSTELVSKIDGAN
jgi:hypothetical protein